MKNTDKYVQKYFEYRHLKVSFCPQEIDEIEPGLIRCEVVDRVARYVEIWDQLCEIPIDKRPIKLREEFDDIWNHFTKAERLRLDTVLEARR